MPLTHTPISSSSSFLLATLPYQGEETTLHRHDHDYIFVVVEASTLLILGENNEELLTYEAVVGHALAFIVQGEELVDATGE